MSLREAGKVSVIHGGASGVGGVINGIELRIDSGPFLMSI